MGDDTIQGDGSIDRRRRARWRSTPGHAPSVRTSAASGADGDDYVEGNGGNDLIFGGLGQDDLIGGSSNLYGLATPRTRPDGTDMIFGGTGAGIGLNDAGDPGATGHAHDADVILGDNGNIFRLVRRGRRRLPHLQLRQLRGLVERDHPARVPLLDYTPGEHTSRLTRRHRPVLDDPRHRRPRRRRLPPRRGRRRHDLRPDRRRRALRRRPGRHPLRQRRATTGSSGGTGDDGVLGDDGVMLTEPQRHGRAALSASHADGADGIESGTHAATRQPGELYITGDAAAYVADLEPFFARAATT